jgi:DnaK suppressor protein
MAAKDILEPSLEVLGVHPYKLKKKEEYMGPQMRAHFTQILTLLRKQIMEEADRTVMHMRDGAVNYADPNDRATQDEEFRLELRASDRKRQLLKKIEESLQILINKEYGYCEVCGVEIGLRRLEARPTATLCIDCKMLDEIKERQHG